MKTTRPRHCATAVSTALLLSHLGGCATPLLTQGTRPPRQPDTIAGFVGRDTTNWRALDRDEPFPWRIEQQSLVVVPGAGSIRSRQEFGDCVISLEFNVPFMDGVTGQARGNSGIYIQDLYEIQILDSFERTASGEPASLGPAIDGCGAIYRQRSADVNACLGPGQWQRYEIRFRAPRLAPDGTKFENARVTVALNGVTIHDDVEIVQPTGSKASRKETGVGPLVLQEHGCPVMFRNVYVFADNPETIAMAPKAAEPIFDGTTLAGWHQLGGKASYRAQDGCIIGTTRPSTPNSFLVTDREFENFELDLDFKVDPGLNSGVQFRSESKPDYQNGRVHGYQADIDPSERAWTAGVYDEGRRGWLASLEKNPVARAAFKQNEWNRMKIVADGGEIRTFLNGVPAATLQDAMTSKGFIGLQVHDVGGRVEPLEVRWKNLRLRETPPAAR